MLKNNRWKLVVSSAVILLPILLGLIFWNEFPEHMTTHWGADGNADGWSGRPFAVFGPPLFILAIHWLCVFFTARDPKNKGQNKKVFGLVLWICPVISLFANGIVYSAALGREFNSGSVTFLFLGLLFVIIGNYLPKCKQNFTIGIKVKWALANEENWNATHRIGGKIWVAGGLLMIACVFLPERVISWALIVLLSVVALIPILYSWLYYKKQVKAGTAPAKVSVPMGRASKIILAAALIFGGGIVLFAGVLTVTGDIQLQYNDSSFTVEASYWDDLTVEYDAIDGIEYREDCEAGSRVNGFGSPKLSMGLFQNDEFGRYTRYSYTGCDACVVLTVEGKILVLSGADRESTRAIYDALLAIVG